MRIPLLNPVMDLVLPWSISSTGPSPQLRALLYGPALPVWCAGDLAPPETRGWEKKRALLCEQEAWRRWSRGKGRGEDSDLGVPWEWTSWLLCFLIPLSAEQQGGRDWRRSKRGRTMMRVKELCFHTKRKGGGGERASVYVSGSIPALSLKVQKWWCLMATK